MPSSVAMERHQLAAGMRLYVSRDNLWYAGIILKVSMTNARAHAPVRVRLHSGFIYWTSISTLRPQHGALLLEKCFRLWLLTYVVDMARNDDNIENINSEDLYRGLEQCKHMSYSWYRAYLYDEPAPIGGIWSI